MAGLGYTKKLNEDFEVALDDVRFALSKEGFGIMTSVNVQEKFQEKLGKTIEKYMILGACNPSIAYDAVQAEQEIGLMMPCNVIVYEKSGEVYVSCVQPSIHLEATWNKTLIEVAQTAENKLKRAIDSL